MEHIDTTFAPPVRIVATRRRRRTVAARLRAGVLELMVPDWMSIAEREHWAEEMRKRIAKQMSRQVPSDVRLATRARALNDKLFGGRLRWSSVAFAEMSSLWGSCSVESGAIRIANKASLLPEWVMDYVLVHEMAHLEHGDHGAGFHELEHRYALTERAIGYLMAIDHGAAHLDDPSGAPME